MSGDIRMTARTQDSPFRESAWDNRLDKMLEDLKTTVSPDGERINSRRDNSLVSSFRSTSRSDSRNSARGVEDGGLMRHHHKEFVSPDKTTRVVSDQYEYDSGDPNKFQKKVMKSTYSSYKVSGDISSDLDSLRQGPSASIMDSARSTSDYNQSDTKVVSASQKVANKLVDALSTIGPDGKPYQPDSSAATTLESQKGGSDYSTLTKLNKNIHELDSMLADLDNQESELRSVIKEQRTTVQTTRTTTQQKIENEILKSQKHDHDISTVSSVPPVKPIRDHKEIEIIKTEGHTPYTTYYSKNDTKYTTLTNGTGKPGTDDDVEIINNEIGGEVRNIVWRNRFEKTYETQDSTPKLSIEDDARRHKIKIPMPVLQPPVPQRAPTSPRHLQLQYAVYYPYGSPNVSPGGQSWADPIPLPTPPNVSPKGEPGVAYIYTYGQSGGTQIQHLPPLNYVAMQKPTSDGQPSPTPSSGNQPIIYHYSYHYTLQPGQPIPEGILQSPGGHPQPALQVAPPIRQMQPPLTVSNTSPPSQTSYEYKDNLYSSSNRHHTSTNLKETNTTVQHHHHHHPPPLGTDREPEKDNTPRFPTGHRDPEYDGPLSGYPRGNRDPPGTTDEPNRNISIMINKTTSHTTHTKEFPNGPSSTSTPYRSRNRSRSPSPPERYPLDSRYPLDGTRPTGPHLHSHHTHVTHLTARNSYSTSDSLERLRKPQHETLPFPDTSPIKPTPDTKIPQRVDDLMTSFDSERLNTNDNPIIRKHSPIPPPWFDMQDGLGHRDIRGMNPPRHGGPSEREPLMDLKNKSNNEMEVRERQVEIKKKEETRNLDGPPVYYPPGHQQLFDESMHTMTLKENKRRGMAKWRMEKEAGYKESSSSSESKGGMAMVPVCLPLCCGAACAIM